MCSTLIISNCILAVSAFVLLDLCDVVSVMGLSPTLLRLVGLHRPGVMVDYLIGSMVATQLGNENLGG